MFRNALVISLLALSKASFNLNQHATLLNPQVLQLFETIDTIETVKTIETPVVQQIQQQPPLPPAQQQPQQPDQPGAHLREPFPSWLHDLTGLDDWPKDSPPYIEMPGIVDLSNIPDVPLRGLGDCRNVQREHCSFDCYQCSTPNEITSCPVLSQTFDDGPSPATPKLLSELKQRTTFFTQGTNVVRFPNIFKSQHASGHLLATHTWDHAHLPSLTNEQIVAQIQWSIWAMNATAGLIPRYFRPPYGGWDNRIRAIVEQFGLVTVFWDHDTFDWKVNDNTKIELDVVHDVNTWLAEAPTGLILEHDSTIKTVNLGVQVSKLLSDQQMTVADCAGELLWYQSSLPKYGINTLRDQKRIGAGANEAKYAAPVTTATNGNKTR